MKDQEYKYTFEATLPPGSYIVEVPITVREEVLPEFLEGGKQRCWEEIIPVKTPAGEVHVRVETCAVKKGNAVYVYRQRKPGGLGWVILDVIILSGECEAECFDPHCYYEKDRLVNPCIDWKCVERCSGENIDLNKLREDWKQTVKELEQLIKELRKRR